MTHCHSLLGQCAATRNKDGIKINSKKKKITHGYFYFPPNVFVPQVSRQSYSLPLMHQPHAHTNAFQSSFVPSSVSVWNHLPHEALTAHSINSFKSLVAPLFLYS